MSLGSVGLSMPAITNGSLRCRREPRAASPSGHVITVRPSAIGAPVPRPHRRSSTRAASGGDRRIVAPTMSV
jgi:hypothetical protein